MTADGPTRTTALAEIRARGRVRGRLPLLGPAFVAAIAYVDPGNFATNFSAGAQFGYRLLWVIVAANLMASGTDRNDVIFDATLGVSRNFRDWLSGSIDYRFVTDQTSFVQAGDDPSYTRHELLVGFRAARYDLIVTQTRFNQDASKIRHHG